MMDIDYLRDNDLIIMECLSGSKAYGLDTPSSDTDIKGVFLLPQKDFYGLNYVPQVNNPTNDIVFYEFGRFMELLSVSNPNIMELLNTPEKAVMSKHPLLNKIKPEMVLSKQCMNTFGKFAVSQIKKAKGLKKKIVNPVAKERKSVLEFCYVNYDQGAIPLPKFLEIKGWQPECCGLVNIPHMNGMYGLYYGKDLGFKGIAKNIDSNDVSLSSIPKGMEQAAVMHFNKNGYSSYCKEYKEYWDWVENRNEARYESTQSHGKNYDAKNMMHTFRLLEMAIEIGRDHAINVQRPNRDFLLSIKRGEFEYDDLLAMADKKQQEMESVFENSTLPDQPDITLINELAFEIRKGLYQS